MPKRLIWLVLALVVVLSACGSDDDSGATDSASDSSAETGTTADSDDDGDTGSAGDAATLPAPTPLPGGDETDLGSKPEVGEQYLVPVDELILTDLVDGTGQEALPGSTVALQYVGVLASDGTQFDASWDRGGDPLTFTIGAGQVIPGWDEGIIGMQVGGRRVLQIPSLQAYGASPPPSIPADADLVFIVDLVAATPPPEPAPPVPEDALGAFDELGIIDLVEGDGAVIEPGDIVSVQYVGVDAVTGQEFDSSWSRGAEPFQVIAGAPGVIEGWQDGLLGAAEGTERVLQIPSAQAYGAGDLVFRVHIESVTPGPLAHQQTYGGPVPSEVETTTLIEGTGGGAALNAPVNGHFALIRHSDSQILQSTYLNDEPTEWVPGALFPGIEQGLEGAKVGETRQIIIPVSVAFPDGPPPAIEADDAIVVIVEVLSLGETS